MSEFDVQALLAPVSDASPCGDDLEYDPAFMAVEEAARGKPEQQFGDTVIPAQDPDWRAMRSGALDLFGRTRDLRVAVYLMRATTRLSGFGGFADGMALLHGLLAQHWDHVYPMLDTEDNNDPTMRLNALAPLVDADSVLADLRAATVGDARAGLTVHQIEVSLGKAEALPGETVIGESGVVSALETMMQKDADLAAQIQSAHSMLVAIDGLIAEKAGGAAGPDFSPLRQVTKLLDDVSRRASGQAQGADEPGEAGADGDGIGAAASAVATPGAIRSRDDVSRTLDRVCEWIERNEPSNPAPLLIRRAQRLMRKNFLEIIRDLAPDGLSEVERVAGTDRE